MKTSRSFTNKSKSNEFHSIPKSGNTINRIYLKPNQSQFVKTPWNVQKTILVTKGRAWIRLNDAHLLISQGDTLDLKSGESYKIEAIGPGKFVLNEFEKIDSSYEFELDELEEQLIRLRS